MIPVLHTFSSVKKRDFTKKGKGFSGTEAGRPLSKSISFKSKHSARMRRARVNRKRRDRVELPNKNKDPTGSTNNRWFFMGGFPKNSREKRYVRRQVGVWEDQKRDHTNEPRTAEVISQLAERGSIRANSPRKLTRAQRVRYIRGVQNI